MKPVGWVLVFVFALLMGACSGTDLKAESTGFLVGSTWHDALARRKQTFERKRPDLTWRDGGRVDNCRNYLRGVAHGRKLAATTRNHVVASHYLVCAVLAMLGPSVRLSQGEAGAARIAAFGQRLAEDLDLRSFPSSLGPRLTAEKHTLATLFPKHLEVKGPRVVVDTPIWHRSLDVLAVADVDHDGVADWLVRYVDESKAGTYRQYDILIVHDPATVDILNATVFTESCRKHEACLPTQK